MRWHHCIKFVCVCVHCARVGWRSVWHWVQVAFNGRRSQSTVRGGGHIGNNAHWNRPSIGWPSHDDMWYWTWWIFPAERHHGEPMYTYISIYLSENFVGNWSCNFVKCDLRELYFVTKWRMGVSTRKTFPSTLSLESSRSTECCSLGLSRFSLSISKHAHTLTHARARALLRPV